ncbi:MAG: large subunit ribosomal protein L21 [Saprospiraceae bacterium]|jgi:large subunit ribosomal protein L21
MYAVVETGGKQYRVSVGDKLKVEKLDVEEGASLQLDKVLMINDDGKLTVGEPHVAGTSVEATVLGQGRGDKIRIVKFKRRKKYRRLQGHRQSFTELEITAIGGSKAAPKKAPAEVAEAKAAPEKKAASAKADASGDKLITINGIGPVIEGKLKDMGISTFAEIAAFTPEQIEEVNGKLSFKGRIEREEWVEQAKALV